MTWNRLFLQNRVKDSFLQARDVDDGLLTNALVQEAIELGMKRIADDCHLLPQIEKLPLREGQWKYPIPEELLGIRSIYYIESDGSRNPVDYIEQERFSEYYSPTNDTGTKPYYFSYPIYQRPVMLFYTAGPPNRDYNGISHVTTKAIRTVIDSGINFGRTLDAARVKPKFLAHNNTDDSYGVVEVLDISTNKASGKAGVSTSATILHDPTVNFISLGVAVDDIICNPAIGTVVKYAFVTAVAATQLTYESIQGGTAFVAGEAYKVGVATEIRLSTGAPVRGLRSGSRNYFSVGDAVCTMTGTTFTPTTVIGTSTSGASAGNIAIANGGSHAKITAIAATQLTVDFWVGGQPTDGETVVVKACDEYQIEDRFRTQKVLWLRPTPSASDDIGEESVEIMFSLCPELPEADTDPIEIPEKYYEPLFLAVRFYAARSRGSHSRQDLADFWAQYRNEVRDFMADVWSPPHTSQIVPYDNSQLPGRRGTRYQTSSGVSWDPTALGL